MDVIQIAKDWGWTGVLLFYFGPKAWTFFADHIWPERIRENRRAEDRKDKEAQAIREADATLLKARIERDDRESETRLKIEERIARAIEGIQSSLAAMQQIQSSIQTQLTNYFNMTFSGIQDVKGGIEKLQDMDELWKRQSKLEKDLERITEPKIPKVEQ